MTQEAKTIPLMGDFDEGSLLDQIKNPGEGEETPEEEAARLALEAKETETEEEKVARLKLEDEEAETEEEKVIRLAKEQEEEELTDEEKAKLAKKKEEEEGSFWEDVEKITGNPVEVDYGDTAPDSPEGAALREEAVVTQGIEANLANLEKKYPRSFQALQHEANGGKFEDLLGEKTTNYAAIVLDKENSVQLKSVLKNYYLDKGLSEEKATRNVEYDEDSDEGLFVNAEAALKEQQATETANSEKILADQAEIKRLQGEQDSKFSTNLSNIISEGSVGNFKIDKKDAEGFYNHVLSQVQRVGDGYALAIPLNGENLESQLQQLFFGFKGGDLSKFVKAESKTEGVRRLKRNLKTDTGAEETGEETRKRTKKLPTLGAFEVD